MNDNSPKLPWELFLTTNAEENIEKNIELQTTKSLNESLHQHLQGKNTNYVLCMINIDQLSNLNETFGLHGGSAKRDQIVREIAQFCTKNPHKLQGFLCNDIKKSQRVLYCILIKCNDNKKLDISQRYMMKLMKHIKQLTSETVSVGIAKMNHWETYDEWKVRAFNNISLARDGKGISPGFGELYSDIKVEFTQPQDVVSAEDEKTLELKEQASSNKPQRLKLGNRSEFGEKIREIMGGLDKNWIMAIMSVDKLGDLTFAKVEKDITKNTLDIFNAFDDNDNKRYFGYKITEEHVYGMILYDCQELNENVAFVSAHDVLEALRSRINSKCSFSVLIGYDRVVMESDIKSLDPSFTNDVIDRVYVKFLKLKKNASNQVVNFGKEKILIIEKNQLNVAQDEHHVDQKVLCLFLFVFCFVLFVL